MQIIKIMKSVHEQRNNACYDFFIFSLSINLHKNFAACSVHLSSDILVNFTISSVWARGISFKSISFDMMSGGKKKGFVETTWLQEK